MGISQYLQGFLSKPDETCRMFRALLGHYGTDVYIHFWAPEVELWPKNRIFVDNLDIFWDGYIQIFRAKLYRTYNIPKFL